MKKLNNLSQKEIEKYLSEAYKDLTEATNLFPLIEDVDDEDLSNTVDELEKKVESMEDIINSKYKDILPEEFKNNLDTNKKDDI